MELRECCFKTLPENGRRLVWEVTHTCHFDCDYCFQSQKRLKNPTRVLNEKDLSKVCKSLPELDVTDVLITGGEIFHVNDIIDVICKELQRLKLPFSFSTAYFTKPEFINKLISYVPRAINISFDPAFVGQDSQYVSYLQRVEHLLKITDINEIDVKLTGVVHKHNYLNYRKYLDDMNILCNKYNSLKSIYVTNPYEVGYIKHNVRLSQKEQGEIFEITRKVGYSEKIKFVNFPLFNKCLQKCPASKYVHLEPTGNMYPCHLLANFSNPDLYLMGNILNDHISDIISNLNSFAKQIDEAVVEYKRITKECGTCSQLNECGGGCLAEIISAGNMIEPQLFCELIPYPETEIHGIAFHPKIISFNENQTDITEQEESRIKEYVFNNIKKRLHDLSHSYDHVVTVVNNARHIAKNEGANLRIVTAAAYFHDFSPRRKLIYESHTKSSAHAAVNFLSSVGFNDFDLGEIFKCIDTSSYGAAEMGIQPHSIEARVVRDADLLDAIGSRGIARVFAFASAHNCETLGDVEWDIDNPPKKTVSLVGPDPSPIYHFFSKLLWVKNEISTATGKALAKDRHEILVAFLKGYKSEMHIAEE